MASLTVHFDECADHTAIPFREARGTIAAVTWSNCAMPRGRGGCYSRQTATTSFACTTEFAARGESHAGIITVPQEPTRPDRFRIRCAMLVAWVAATAGPANRLFRWTDLQHMITKGVVADSFTEEEIALALGQR